MWVKPQLASKRHKLPSAPAAANKQWSSGPSRPQWARAWLCAGPPAVVGPKTFCHWGQVHIRISLAVGAGQLNLLNVWTPCIFWPTSDSGLTPLTLWLWAALFVAMIALGTIAAKSTAIKPNGSSALEGTCPLQSKHSIFCIHNKHIVFLLWTGSYWKRCDRKLYSFSSPTQGKWLKTVHRSIRYITDRLQHFATGFEWSPLQMQPPVLCLVPVTGECMHREVKSYQIWVSAV